jgi:hypothetical protein
MKPTLKAPGSERLKLKYDDLLSNFAFNCNLRHYSMDATMKLGIMVRNAPACVLAAVVYGALGHMTAGPRQPKPETLNPKWQTLKPYKP